MTSPAPKTKTKSAVMPSITKVLSGLVTAMRADGRFAGKPIAQPHPLLILVRNADKVVLVAPAVAWVRKPSRSSALRSICLIWVSRRS